MLKQLFEYRYNKTSLKSLFMHVVFLIPFCIFWGTMLYCSYKAGYDAAQENSYFGIMLLSLIIFIPVTLVCTIIYIVFISKNAFKYKPQSVLVLIALLFLIIILTSFCIPASPAEGYYDYVKVNVDIDEIHQWLIDYEFKKFDDPGFGNVFESNWPECIQILNPRGVEIYEKNSIRYVRIIYFFGPFEAFGLCVMESPVDVPAYDPDETFSRIQLQDNAFVWLN